MVTISQIASSVQIMWLHGVGIDKHKIKTKHDIKSSFLKREMFSFQSSLFKEEPLKNIWISEMFQGCFSSTPCKDLFPAVYLLVLCKQ